MAVTAERCASHSIVGGAARLTPSGILAQGVNDAQLDLEAISRARAEEGATWREQPSRHLTPLEELREHLQLPHGAQLERVDEHDARHLDARDNERHQDVAKQAEEARGLEAAQSAGAACDWVPRGWRRGGKGSRAPGVA